MVTLPYVPELSELSYVESECVQKKEGETGWA